MGKVYLYITSILNQMRVSDTPNLTRKGRGDQRHTAGSAEREAFHICAVVVLVGGVYRGLPRTVKTLQSAADVKNCQDTKNGLWS